MDKTYQSELRDIVGSLLRLARENGVELHEVIAEVQNYDSVRQLGLSTRAENALVAADVFTFEQLLDLTPRDLKGFPNLGNTSIKEVYGVLEKYGYAPVKRLAFSDLPLRYHRPGVVIYQSYLNPCKSEWLREGIYRTTLTKEECSSFFSKII